MRAFEEKQNKVVQNFRVTPTEKEILKAEAEKRDITVTDLIRKAIFEFINK